MADVEMHHPNLPADQTITVADVSVPVHEASGWKRTTAKKPAEPVKPTKEK